MVNINLKTFEIEAPYGDDIILTFNFIENEQNKNLNEDVILTVKEKPEEGYPELLRKVYTCNNQHEATFSISSDDLITAGITPGIYYYDLYLATSKETVIEPTLLTIKEVVHNVD